MAEMGRLKVLRRMAGSFVVDNFFRGAAAVGRLHPMARPERHNVEVIRDVPYLDGGHPDHVLDIYRPLNRTGRVPVVLYIHGGGFRILSKDTHWVMGLAFARQGYLVFNISYRLAPRHPFPAAIADACEAYRYVVEHAPNYGGDLSRLIVAGESAGANLATGVTLSACSPRSEPWAKRVFETEVTPRVTIPACGILQVTDPQRFRRNDPRLSVFLADRVHEVHDAYLRGVRPERPEELDLADPLLVLERGEAPVRPLPAFFAPCGGADPLLDDTRRLEAALKRLGAVCEAPTYDGEHHAFHAMVFRAAARRCWRDLYQFLDAHVG